ncbi:MAG: amidohydrolase family protein [Armatimonadetes bacterium]|nr:amidohydrolase family protein [Armatimonadota bacterium]
MIIDADCHISPTAEGGVSIGIDELLRRMDRAGVGKAMTWLQPPYRREIDEANAYVYEATRRCPDRILGFGWADPNLGVERAVTAARRCIEEYGFYGVKLNGAQNSFYLDDPQISIPVIDEVARLGSRLAFHVGADAFEQTHPFRVAKIAANYPDLPILAVHMGGVGHADLTNAMIEFAQQYSNITLIGSAVREVAVLKAIHTIGASRVCFGSDTPFSLMHVEVAKYHALLDGEVSSEEKALVMGANIARLLGLR